MNVARLRLSLSRLPLLVLVIPLGAQGIAVGGSASFSTSRGVSESWVRLDGGGVGSAIVIDQAGYVHSAGIGGGGVLLKNYTPGGMLQQSTAYPNRVLGHMTIDDAGDLVLVGRREPDDVLWVSKIRTDGVILWEQFSPLARTGSRVAVGPQGDIYLIASTSTVASGRNYATLKYDAQGNFQWQRLYDGPNNFDDSAKFLDVRSDGSVVVTGTSTGGSSGFDVATLLYDANGNQLWTARYSGPETDEGLCVRFDAAGNVYVCGTTLTSNSFDFLLVKYDSTGVEQWARTYDGPLSSGDYGRRLHVLSTGDVVVVGDSGGLVTIESAVLAYDSAGNRLWTRRHSSGTFAEVPLETALGANDAVYVTGQGGVGQSGYVTFSYSRFGELRWDALYLDPGPASNDRATSIALGPDGAVAVTGRTPFTTIRYRER